MESFAPAYFDYMSSAVIGNVRSFPSQSLESVVIELPIAAHAPCEDLWMLQDHFQEDTEAPI